MARNCTRLIQHSFFRRGCNQLPALAAITSTVTRLCGYIAGIKHRTVGYVCLHLSAFKIVKGAEMTCVKL